MDSADPATPSPTPEAILRLGFGYWGSKTLLSAVELGVFTALGDGPLTADELRQRLALDRRGARDFFDALVALGMLERNEGRYRNAPDTALFLVRGKPGYIGGILEMTNAREYGFWGGLTPALRDGRPRSEVQDGEDVFSAMYADPAQLRSFLASMTGLTLGTAKALAHGFDWSPHRRVVDLGAAQGALPVQVALAQKHLSAGGMDLSPVGPVFDEYVASFGLSDRVRFHPGDFFHDPLPDADVYVMSHVLHDWDLEQKRALVRKAWEALPAGGALIVIEALIDDARRQNALALLMSLTMLLTTQGGFNYSAADCLGWLHEAGFGKTRVVHLAGPDSMIVAIK